jgi:hypothetical protein
MDGLNADLKPFYMYRKLLLRLIAYLYKITYQKYTLDKVNSKLIRPVPGLIIDGEQYWEFVQVADMPEGRRAHYNTLREEMTMGIDREMLLEFVEKLKEANAKSDVNRIGALLFTLEDIVKNITTVESLYNLASLAYFTEREDLTTFDYDLAMVKVKAFKKLPNKSFFFDRLLRETLKISGDQLPADIETFLVEGAAKLRAYQMILRGGTDE